MPWETDTKEGGRRGSIGDSYSGQIRGGEGECQRGWEGGVGGGVGGEGGEWGEGGEGAEGGEGEEVGEKLLE